MLISLPRPNTQRLLKSISSVKGITKLKKSKCVLSVVLNACHMFLELRAQRSLLLPIISSISNLTLPFLRCKASHLYLAHFVFAYFNSAFISHTDTTTSLVPKWNSYASLNPSPLPVFTVSASGPRATLWKFSLAPPLFSMVLGMKLGQGLDYARQTFYHWATSPGSSQILFIKLPAYFYWFHFLKLPFNPPLHCSIAVKTALYERKHLMRACLQFQRFSPLSSW